MLRPLLCVASLASALIGQSEPRVVATRSLQPFLPPSLQSPMSFDSAIPNNEQGNGSRSGTQRNEGENDNDAAWLKDLLRERHRKAFEVDDLTIAIDANSRISLHGSKEAVNACLADLDAIAASLARSIEITAYRLPVPNGDLPPAFLSGATLQKTIADEEPIWSARAITRPGGSVQLGDARWTAYVRDQDVEVAKKAHTEDPKVDHLFEGTRLSLTVHALPNEELILHGAWLVSERLMLEETTTGKDKASIELPHHKTSYATFAGKVRNGDGLLVAAKELDASGQEFVFAVCARYLTPPPTRVDSLFVFPASAWLQTTSTAWPLRAARFIGEDSAGQHPIVRRTPLLGPQKLAEFVAGGGTGTATMAGTTLIISDTNAVCARAEARLQMLANSQLRGAELRIHSAASQTATATKIVQPVLANLQARAFVGRERSLVADFEVEIAENATDSNPVVQTARGGVWSRLTAHPMGRDWNVMGIWRTARQLNPRLRGQPDGRKLQMQLPDYKTTIWPWDGPLQPNKTFALSPTFAIELRTQ